MTDDVPPLPLDGWQSGRLRTLGKRVCPNRHPGFESLPIRNSHKQHGLKDLCKTFRLNREVVVTDYYNTFDEIRGALRGFGTTEAEAEKLPGFP